MAVPKKYNSILVFLFLWYTWALVKFNSVRRVFIRYFGAYAPLWVITCLVGWYNMDKKTVENDDGDMLQIKMAHVEFLAKQNFSVLKKSITWNDSSEDGSDQAQQLDVSEKPVEEFVTQTQAYHYDITARALWYLHFNEYYDEFCQYVIDCMPFDLNEHLFRTSSIMFKYSGTINGLMHVRTLTYDFPGVILSFDNNGDITSNPSEMHYTLVDNMMETEHPVMYNTLIFP